MASEPVGSGHGREGPLTDNVTSARGASRPGGAASRSGGTAGRPGGTASRPDTSTGAVGGRPGEGRARGAARTNNGAKAISGVAESASTESGRAESGRAAADRARRPGVVGASSDGTAPGSAAGEGAQVRIVIPDEQ